MFHCLKCITHLLVAQGMYVGGAFTVCVPYRQYRQQTLSYELQSIGTC